MRIIRGFVGVRPFRNFVQECNNCQAVFEVTEDDLYLPTNSAYDQAAFDCTECDNVCLVSHYNVPYKMRLTMVTP